LLSQALVVKGKAALDISASDAKAGTDMTDMKSQFDLILTFATRTLEPPVRPGQIKD
jgi:hypothetical protein